VHSLQKHVGHVCRNASSEEQSARLLVQQSYHMCKLSTLVLLSGARFWLLPHCSFHWLDVWKSCGWIFMKCLFCWYGKQSTRFCWLSPKFRVLCYLQFCCHEQSYNYCYVWCRDVTELESISDCCRIPTIFSEIRRIFRVIWIQIQLLFWKAQVHHSSQSAISHTKVNKCTLNGYLLMSVKTTHLIGP